MIEQLILPGNENVAVFYKECSRISGPTVERTNDLDGAIAKQRTTLMVTPNGSPFLWEELIRMSGRSWEGTYHRCKGLTRAQALDWLKETAAFPGRFEETYRFKNEIASMDDAAELYRTWSDTVLEGECAARPNLLHNAEIAQKKARRAAAAAKK